MSFRAPSSPIELPGTGKARLPRQPPGHIRREALQRRLLDQACRLRLLIAPAGFGKSVLLADCARECRADCTLLWLDWAGQACSAAQFCWQLSVALGYPPTADDAVLRVALQQDERRLWLMLNDYPREPDADLDACLERLLAASAPSHAWWLTSRRRPACNWPRLLLEGELFELGSADLAFTADEVAAWLQPLDPSRNARADRFFALTQGWPAALRLLAAQVEREGGGPPSRDEHGDLLRAYIEHDVLQGLPAELLGALCQLAQLSRFNEALCEHLLGVGEGAVWLQQLRARGLFIEEVEGRLGWFEVFAPVARLLQTRGGSRTTLHLHASEWFAAQGDIRAAVEHALLGGQPEVACSFLERFTEEQLLQGQDLALILRWRSELPDTLLASTPRLILLNAWVLLLVGRLTDALTCVDQLARFQPRAEGARTRELFAQWQAIQGIAAYARGYAPEARAHLLAALPALPDSAWSQALLCRSALTQVAIGEGHLERAQQLSCEALKHARLSGSSVFEALLELDHGLLLEARGEFARAETLLQRVLDHLGAPRLGQTPVLGRIQLRLGRLALRQGRHEAAVTWLMAGLEGALNCGDPVAFHGYLGLAELAASQQDTATAFALLAQAERLMQRQRVSESLYRGTLLLASSRLWLRQGHYARVRETATRVIGHGLRRKTLLGPPNFPELFPRLQMLLLQLDLQQGEDVRAPLRALLDEALSQGRQALACELWLLGAEACAAANDPAAASQARQAGQALRERLDYQGLWFAGHPPAPPTTAPNGEVPLPLSGRELAVLGLIALGLSNQEIAERLFISLHTVKTHARRINGKLGVARRTQAVAAAKALGLL